MGVSDLAVWMGPVKCVSEVKASELGDTVDDINPALRTLRTLNYGNYGIFLSMGNAGFIS